MIKFSKLFVVIFSIIIGAVSIITAETPTPPLTAIISAFGEEVQLIDRKIQDRKVQAFIGH